MNNWTPPPSWRVEIPQQWTTKRPTEPGHYWVYDTRYKDVYLVELAIRRGSLYEIDSDEYVDFLDTITHWMGPLVAPSAPQLCRDFALMRALAST